MLKWWKWLLWITVMNSCSSSWSGDVAVYVFDVFDINHRACPLLFVLFLCLFVSLWPFPLYCIPWILQTTLCFLTLFFWSLSALVVLSTVYLFMKVSLSPDIILCGWLGLGHQLTNQLTYELLQLVWLICDEYCRSQGKLRLGRRVRELCPAALVRWYIYSVTGFLCYPCYRSST